MGNKEINLAINKFRGVKSYTGAIDTLSSLIDYFLLDASYDIFCKRIRTLPLKQKDKQIVKKIVFHYTRFFKKTNAAFSRDQQDYLLDKCDEMQSSIAKHVEIARIALMECYNMDDLDTQGRKADLWQCILLAKEALEYHGKAWKAKGFKQDFKAGKLTVHGVVHTAGEIDKDIDGVLKWCYELATRLFVDSDITKKHLDRLELSISVVTNKIHEWVVNDYEKEINERAVDTAEIQTAGEGTKGKDEGGVGVRRRGKHKGEALCDSKNNDSARADSGGLHAGAGGLPVGPQPCYDSPLREKYGHLPDIPGV